MNSKDIQGIRDYINHVKNDIEGFQRRIDEVLNQYSNNEIIQSLFESGEFGQEKKEQLEKMGKAMKELYESIAAPGMLVDKTKEYCDEQERLIHNTSY